jgi:hypothetical protein
MKYTFQADGKIKNQEEQTVLQIKTKRGKPWKIKKLKKIINKHGSLIPFKNELGSFSILASHKKTIKNKKYKLYDLNEDGRINAVTRWFKIKTSQKKWLKKNDYDDPNLPVELTIVEEITDEGSDVPNLPVELTIVEEITDEGSDVPNLPVELTIVNETPNGAHGYFNFLFSGNISGFNQSDIEVIGGKKGSFYNDGYNDEDDITSYGMYVERDDSQMQGTLIISIRENSAYSESGNTNNAARYSSQYDYKAPTIEWSDEWSDDFSVEYTQANETFTINLKFSEVINDFQREFLEITGGTIGTITTLNENLEYKIELIPNPNTEHAWLTLSLDRFKISDKEGNILQLADEDYRRPYDTKQPSSTVKLMCCDQPDTTKLYNRNSGVFVYIEFSEEVNNFKKEDIVVNGGQMSSFSSSSHNREAWFNLKANENESGIIEVYVKDNSYTDMAGNVGSGSNLWTIPYDREAPFITTESFSTDPLTGIIAYRYDFSEPVNGLLSEHIEVYEKTDNHHQPWKEISSELIQSDDRMSYAIQFKPTNTIGYFSTDIQMPITDDFSNHLTVGNDYNVEVSYSI